MILTFTEIILTVTGTKKVVHIRNLILTFYDKIFSTTLAEPNTITMTLHKQLYYFVVLGTY